MSALGVHPHSILNYPEHYNEVLTVKIFYSNCWN